MLRDDRRLASGWSDLVDGLLDQSNVIKAVLGQILVSPVKIWVSDREDSPPRTS